MFFGCNCCNFYSERPLPRPGFHSLTCTRTAWSDGSSCVCDTRNDTWTWPRGQQIPASLAGQSWRSVPKFWQLRCWLHSFFAATRLQSFLCRNRTIPLKHFSSWRKTFHSFSSFLPTPGRSAKEHGRGGWLKPWSPYNQSMPTHPPFQARLGADFRRTDGSGCRVRGKKSFTKQRCEEFHKTSKLRRILSSLPPDVRRRHCLIVTVHWSGESRYQNPLFYIYWYEFKPVHLGIGFFVSSLRKPQQSHERLGLAGRHHGSSLSEGGAKDANISCSCPETLSCSKP